MKQIGYLGAGTWGIALSSLLAGNGHRVTLWGRDPTQIKRLRDTREHPKLPGFTISDQITFTTDLKEAVRGKDFLVESVTSVGIRPLFEKLGAVEIPIVITSKGLEKGTGLLLPEVIAEILGNRSLVGVLSGPSHAEEVIGNLPTSIVCSAYEASVMKLILDAFTTPNFRIYPNGDVNGVCFGGAMKNIIAIACGISDGLLSGDNAKASLMTRGLHEMRKLSNAKSCNPETLNGLSGMGDLCVTCLSTHSRNYRFGKLVAEGYSPEGARQKIGMAVEGIYACVSLRELARKEKIPVPITEATYAIIYDGLDPREAVRNLLQRAIKEEHL